MHLHGNAGLLPECSIDNRSKTAQVKGRTAPYFLFVTATTDRPSTARCSQAVQNYTRRVEIASGKGCA